MVRSRRLRKFKIGLQTVVALAMIGYAWEVVSYPEAYPVFFAIFVVVSWGIWRIR